MSIFSSLIPIRANGDDIIAAWFNTIRSALIAVFGDESLGQTRFSGLASQTNTIITDLIFDKTVTRKAEISYAIVTATKVESGNYTALYDGSNWVLYSGAIQGVNSAITLDINTSTGQVDYTSGGEVFDIDYKVITFNI